MWFEIYLEGRSGMITRRLEKHYKSAGQAIRSANLMLDKQAINHSTGDVLWVHVTVMAVTTDSDGFESRLVVYTRRI